MFFIDFKLSQNPKIKQNHKTVVQIYTFADIVVELCWIGPELNFLVIFQRNLVSFSGVKCLQNLNETYMFVG